MLKKILPLFIAIAAHLGCSEKGRTTKSGNALPLTFQQQCDSVDHALRAEVEKLFGSVEMGEPIITEIDTMTFADTAHYNVLKYDSTSRLRRGYYDLRTAVGQHNGKKQGFVYKYKNHTYLLPMENAEKLVELTNGMSQFPYTEPLNLYLEVSNDLNAYTLDAKYDTLIEKKSGHSRKWSIVAASKLLQLADDEMISSVMAHEEGHFRKYRSLQTLGVTPAQEKNYSDDEWNERSRILELGADRCAAKKKGTKAVQASLVKTFLLSLPSTRDNLKTFWENMKFCYSLATYNLRTNNHPSIVDRMYILQLMDEFEKNKSLAAVYISLMPEDLKALNKFENK